MRPSQSGRSESAGYAALDGWRGICATLVALFHFRVVWSIGVNSHFAHAAIVKNASLFVDFFFVLSGFVIAYRYRDGLTARTIRLRDFLVLRLGRLYPLHLFTLLLCLALVLFFRYGTHGADHVTWSGDDVTPVAFVVNLFLAQGLHILTGPSWNHPSWSISAEFATYFVYAVLWIRLGSRTWIATTLILVVAPVVVLGLIGNNIDVTYDWGFVRSMLGFALGTVAFSVSRHVRVRALLDRLTRAESTIVEAVLLALTYAFVVFAADTPYSFAAPFLFAGVVLVFSEERGAVTAALISRPLQSLGRLSYSIYMLYFPLQVAMTYAAVELGRAGWLSLFALQRDANGPPSAVLGRSLWAGDVATILMLGLLFGGSVLTYRWVEQPWRERARRLVQRKSA